MGNAYLKIAASFEISALQMRDHFKWSQRQHRVRRVLRPDGYLILGGAETTLDDNFVPVALGQCSFYRPRPNQRE
jgi:hypothetical protein